MASGAVVPKGTYINRISQAGVGGSIRPASHRSGEIWFAKGGWCSRSG